MLPGVYAAPEVARSWQTRVRALGLRHVDAVLLGAAAARISFWPEAPLDRIEAAVPCVLKPQPGFSFSRRYIPAELITERGGLRCSVPALTAIDMATFACSDALDVALRARAATLARMYEALRLTPHRAGNRERLKLLIDSRSEPWSAAERPVSCLLSSFAVGVVQVRASQGRRGRDTGSYADRGERREVRAWAARTVKRPRRHDTRSSAAACGSDQRLGDQSASARGQSIVLHRYRVQATEAGNRDRWTLHETDKDLFESDRWRQNALVASGWWVLRFTMSMLRDHPEAFIAAILDALH